MRKFLTAAAATVLLAACSNADSGTVTADTASKTSKAVKEAASGSSKTYNKAAKFDGAKLDAILKAQPEKAQALSLIHI